MAIKYTGAKGKLNAKADEKKKTEAAKASAEKKASSTSANAAKNSRTVLPTNKAGDAQKNKNANDWAKASGKKKQNTGKRPANSKWQPTEPQKPEPISNPYFDNRDRRIYDQVRADYSPEAMNSLAGRLVSGDVNQAYELTKPAQLAFEQLYKRDGAEQIANIPMLNDSNEQSRRAAGLSKFVLGNYPSALDEASYQAYLERLNAAEQLTGEAAQMKLDVRTGAMDGIRSIQAQIEENNKVIEASIRDKKAEKAALERDSQLQAQLDELLRIANVYTYEDFGKKAGVEFYAPGQTYADAIEGMRGYTFDDYQRDVQTIEDGINRSVNYGAEYGSEYGNALKRVSDHMGVDADTYQRRIVGQMSRNNRMAGLIDADPFGDATIGGWKSGALNHYDMRAQGMEEYYNQYVKSLGLPEGAGSTLEDYMRYQEAWARQDETEAAAAERQEQRAADQQARDAAILANPSFAAASQYTEDDLYRRYDVDGDGTVDQEYAEVDNGAALNYLVHASGQGEEAYRAALDTIAEISPWAATMQDYGLEYMSDEDRAKFYAVYHTQGAEAARQYIAESSYDWRRQYAEAQSAARQEYIANAPWYEALGANIASVGATAMNNLGGAANAIGALFGAEIDEYDPSFAFGNASNDIRGVTGARIEAATQGWNIPILDQNIFQAMYQAATSAADNALNIYTGGAGYSALSMAAGAFNSSYQAGLASGKSDRDAYVDALYDGAVEAVTEYISDRVFVGEPKNPLKYWGKNTLTEGAEEIGGDVLKLAYDELKNGDRSQLSRRIGELVRVGYSEDQARSMATQEWMKDTALDGIIGAMSGAMMSGPRAITTYAGDVRTGRDVRGKGNERAMLEVAQGLDLDDATKAMIAEQIGVLDAQEQQEAEQGEQLQAEAESEDDPFDMPIADDVPLNNDAQERDSNLAEGANEGKPSQRDVQAARREGESPTSEEQSAGLPSVAATAEGRGLPTVQEAAEAAAEGLRQQIEALRDRLAEFEAQRKSGRLGLMNDADRRAAHAEHMNDMQAMNDAERELAELEARRASGDRANAEYADRAAEKQGQIDATNAARAEEQRALEQRESGDRANAEYADRAAEKQGQIDATNAARETQARREGASPTSDERFGKSPSVAATDEGRGLPTAQEVAEAVTGDEAGADAPVSDSDTGKGKKGSKGLSAAKLGMIYRAAMTKLDEAAQDVLREFTSRSIVDALKDAGFDQGMRRMKETAMAILRILDGTMEQADEIIVGASSAARSVLSAWSAKVQDYNAILRRQAELGKYRTEDARAQTDAPDDEPEDEEALENAPAKDAPAAQIEFTGLREEIAAANDGIVLTGNERSALEGGTEISIVGYDAQASREAGRPMLKVTYKTAPIENEGDAHTDTDAQEVNAEERVETVDAQDVQYGTNDADAFKLASYAYRLGENGDALYDGYDGAQDADEYGMAYLTAEQAGEDGRNPDVLRQQGAVSALTEEQASAAYELGRELRFARNAQAADVRPQNRVSVGNVDMSGVNIANLNGQQKAGVRAITQMAHVVGFNVKFYESKADSDGKYSAAHGSWNGRTKTMSIDVHAGANSTETVQYAMMHTAGHELTHFIRESGDAKLWNDYQDFVIGHLDQKMDIDAEIAKQRRLNPGISRDGAIEEIIADASSEALSRITDAQLAEMAASNDGLFQRIKDFFDRWIKAIRRRIASAYKGSAAYTDAAREMLDRVEEMAEKWNRMLVKASEMAQEEMRAQATAEQGDGEKYSARAFERAYETAEEGFDAWCNRVENMTDAEYAQAKQSTPLIMVSETTPEILQEYGAKDRKILMRLDALYLAIRSKGAQEGHYHNLGAENMSDVIQQINDPDAILEGKGGRYMVLTHVNTKRGQAMASFEFDAIKDFQGKNEATNLIVTAFDYEKRYLNGLFKKHGAKLRYAKETLSQVNPQLHEWLETFNESASEEIVPHASESVKQKFSQRDFGEQIEELANGTFPMNDHLYVMETPQILMDAGLDQLPILMTQRHARSVMKVTGNENVNYHGFTKTGMKRLPQAIADSALVIKAPNYDNRVIAFTGMKNAAGDVVIAPIEIGIEGRWESAKIRANLLATAYGKSNIKKMIVDAIMNDEVLAIDKKRSFELSKNVGVQFPQNLFKQASTRSIRDYSGNVNTEAAEIEKKSTRDPDAMSDRELLSMALAHVAQNPEEHHRLELYQKKISELNGKEARLAELRRTLTERRAQLKGMKGEAAKALKYEIARDQNRAVTLSEQIRRADQRIMDLEAMRPMKEIVKRARAEQRQKQSAKLREYRDELRAEASARIAGIRADQRQKIAQYRENVYANSYRERLDKDVRTMRQWLATPTNKGHVPEFLRGPLGDFIEQLDFSSRRRLSGTRDTKADERMIASMEAMSRALVKVRNQQTSIDSGAQEFAGYIDLPQGFEATFAEMTEAITEAIQSGAAPDAINRLNREQLRVLSDSVRTIMASIRQMNRLIANSRYQTADKAANATIERLEKLGAQKDRNRISEGMRRFMDWTNATPIYAFKRFGDGGESIFEGLQDGWDKLAVNSKRAIDYANSAYTTQQVRAWSRELHEIELSGKKVKMTTAQIMSLYCLSRRAQAKQHLLGGGIRIADIESGIKKKISQVDNHMLSEIDIMKITGKLTGEQVKVAKALQRFMVEECGKWGNEVSMKRFGYEMFGEANYFPIETDSNNRRAIDEQAHENSLFRLLNLSATKALVPHANNAIIIRDIFEVFSSHTADMAKYNALALPILDALKWYNFVEKVGAKDVKDFDERNTQRIIDRAKGKALEQSDEAFDTRSVQKAIEKAYGKNAQRYITNFLRDLNGVREGGRNDGFYNKLLSNYKVASVATNLRVGFLQITSMPRAAYCINPKYLAIGVKRNVGFRNTRIAQEKVGIALWKSMGFYDTNVARNIRDQIRHDQSLAGKAREKSMLLAEKGDAWTMGVLWGAVEAEMAEKRPGLKKGSRAYDEAMNRRMREIIYHTQVVDSTMTRSDIMRDTKGRTALVTSFMSEPTLAVNMLANEVFQARMKAREKGVSVAKALLSSRTAVRTLAVSACVTALSTIFEAAFTAMRDDDEYEEFGEKFRTALGEGAIENLNPFNDIIYLKDIASIIKYGSGGDNMTSEGAANLIKGVQGLYKYLTGESDGSTTAYGYIYKALSGASQLSGFAASNLLRELVSIYNTVAGEAGWRRIQTYEDSNKDAASAIIDAREEGRAATADRYERIADLRGIDSGKREKAAGNVIIDRYEGNEIDRSRATSMLVKYAGKDADEAKEAIIKSDYKIETGLAYGNMKDDYLTGKIDAATVRRYESKLTDSKKTDDKLKKWDYEAATGRVYGEMRDDYASGKITASEAKKWLMKVGGKTAEDADYTIDGYECYKATGWEDHSKYWRMYNAFENGGDFAQEARAWLDAGVKKGTIASSISGRYKEKYLAIRGTAEGDAMLENLLDLYEAIGYNRNSERRYIERNWKPEDD